MASRMRISWLIFALLVVGPVRVATAQSFGNEWIKPNQQYYKVTVGETGIYRLTYADLQAAGFPVAGVDPRRVQLFFRGKEQAIVVQGQQDARFDPADVILFYGQQNDGTLDAELYVAPEAQPHPYHNLYSDTTAYFLTWRLDAGVGQRMATFAENNVTNLPTEPFHLKEEARRFATEFSAGRQYPLGATTQIAARLSAFDYGEGWTGTRLKQGETADYPLRVASPAPTGPRPQLTLVLAGRNGLPHSVTVQVGPNAGSLRPLTDVTFDYYDSYQLTESLEWSDVGAGQFVVRLTVNGVGGKADNISLSYARLTYAQSANAESGNLAINLPTNTAGKSYVVISNPPPNPILLDITNTDAPEQIAANVVGEKLTAVVPNTAAPRRLLLGEAKAASVPRRVEFATLDATATFWIISHADLHQPGGRYSDPVAAYQAYRSSPEGGSHRAEWVDVDQLYDQFSYGEASPVAIRRFCRYLFDQGRPEYLLLIGKGLTVDYNYHRRDPAINELVYFVPTGGYPGSDAVFSAGLGNSDGITPGVVTGRINAYRSADVASYLDKVKEQEAATLTADYEATDAREALWKKRLLHISGGITANEFTTFGRYVDDFKQVATGDFLGGKVSTLSKKSDNATELINVSEEVNQGVALITFFGHSSAVRIDIDIGWASDDELGYRNQGKYPAILMNGCNAGNIFSNTYTFGENWISTPNRGALNVVAHSSTGLSSVLKGYSDSFYQTALGDSVWIDQPLGKAKIEAERRLLSTSANTWEAYPAHVQQMVLQGDPAVLLFGRGRPDYEVNAQRVSVKPLQPGPVTASSDSFAVELAVRNFGRTSRDSLAVQINRTLGNGTTVTYGPRYFPPVAYQDTLRFTISSTEVTTSADQSSGNNRFEVILDEANRVPELNEDNNRAILEYFVPVSGTVNLLPHNYALVSSPAVALQVQPGNLPQALAGDQLREFLIELDTSAYFDSPLKRQTSLSATALGQWPVNLPIIIDSTVYYWRSRYATPQEGEVEEWTPTSFTYVNNSPSGWAQRQAAQFLEDEVTGLTYDNRWKFIETQLSVAVDAYGSEHAEEFPSVLVNGKNFIITGNSGERCRDDSFNGMAFDRNSLQPYLPLLRPGYDRLDPNSCGPLPQVINTFSNQQVATGGLLDQFVDKLKEGDPVFLFSIGELNYAGWSAATLEKLREIGVDTAKMRDLQSGEPLIILGRKNAAPGSATVVRADTTGGQSAINQAISLNEQITGQYQQGSIVSARIGPASAWTSLQTRVIRDQADSVKLSLIGESNSGQTTVLIDNVTEPTVDISTISAAQYPYLRLRFETEDAVDQTPAQLKQWLVHYIGVPEGTLLHTAVAGKSTLAEGEPFFATFDFCNASAYDFTDSLAVVYTFTNQPTQAATTDTMHIAPLFAGDTVTFSIATSTVGRAGVNDLVVNVNPRLLPEQSYHNNRASLPDFFTVIPDHTHPVLDVAFDGKYINNGDVVSPRPLIAVVVRDENPILRKQDTTGIHLYLKKHGVADAVATDFERVRLSADNVTFAPATNEQPFTLTFQPELEDGTYTLRVQGEDASGNVSATQPYEISFVVVNQSTIICFYPYPNPLSTDTYFTFTLTGPTVPERLAVHIMNVTGQVVRDITTADFGALRLGSENVRYRWDGRDRFGNLLPNGMYLYRTVVQGSTNFELRTASEGRSVSTGVGKLFILR